MAIITAQQLNSVAELLGTTDKNIIFSAIIKTLVDAGLPMAQAFDALFGEGAYSKFAGDVYDALKKSA